MGGTGTRLITARREPIPALSHCITTMAREHTYAEIASSFELWQEFVDRQGAMSREEFDAMSHADRVAIQIGVFGPEDLVPTVADLLEQTAISNGLHRWAVEGGSIEVPADVLRPILEDACDPSMPNWPAMVEIDYA
jgi:hypothetical protein